ncbi:MAG TPA: hypothetical protein VHV77_07150 [Pirellulales bacterium]|nr:hypothetical protein [Pirellulales bacterium]
MSLPRDTSAHVEIAQLDLLRKKSPTERLAIAIRLSQDVIAASKRAIARRHPELSQRERDYVYVELQYGKELADSLRQFDPSRP